MPKESAGQVRAFRFSQPQTDVATKSTRPMTASHNRPSMMKPRIERTSQITSSVMMSPMPEA